MSRITSRTTRVFNGASGPEDGIRRGTFRLEDGSYADAVVPVSPDGSAVSPASVPLGYHQLTDLTQAQALPDVPDEATVATVIAEGGMLRVRKDGVDPTPAVGMPVPAGSGVKLYGNEIRSARFVGVDEEVVLNVEYGR